MQQLNDACLQAPAGSLAIPCPGEAGIYRCFVVLASGRYAMLDDGMGFSLVPWRPVIEQRLRQQLAATVRGGGVSWEIGRQRGPSIG